MSLRLLPAVCLLAACGAAEADAPEAGVPSCLDRDGDGHRAEACGGDDCDDGDRSVWLPAVCQGLCDVDDRTPGCPCNAPSPEPCYSGPPGTVGVGECVEGFRECRYGAWTECLGDELPYEEYCNYLDEDCNGVVDDDLRIDCVSCYGHFCIGAHCRAPFEPPCRQGLEPCGGETDCLTLMDGVETGTYRHVFQPFCGDPSNWEELEFEVQVPEGTSIRFEFRLAESLEALPDADWSEPVTVPPASSPFYVGGEQYWLEVLVTLSGSGASRPRFLGMKVGIYCTW